MDKINNFIGALIPYAEWIMLFFVIGGGVFLLFSSKLKPYLLLRHAIEIVRGKHDDPNDPGQISHLQALSSAVAATVGLGNISGVAIAIYQGGPGVVFWMWLTAVIGMVIKFYSCSLAVMFRSVSADGKIESGPMHYMTKGMGLFGKPLAVFFSLAGLVGFLGVFTVNQFTQTFMSVVNPDRTILDLGDFNWKLIIGLTLSLLTSFVVFGGLKKIARVATAIVPFMVGLYFLAVVFIMLTNSGDILPSFKLIFEEAFNFETAMKGGFWGLVILGVRRAVFSNESGLGSAPMYHGESKTNEPVQEGLVAMLGPFIDTIIVCTLTALTIIISGAYLEAEDNGIAMTLLAFEKSLFGFGDILLMLIVSAFAMSTLFTYSYYGVKCLGFITGPKIARWFNVYFVTSITFAAVTSVGVVINLIDLAYALMCIPNMIAVVYLSPGINRAMDAYLKKMKTTVVEKRRV